MAKWDLSKLNQVGHDPVEKPVHYNQAGIECIDAIEAMDINLMEAITCTAGVNKYFVILIFFIFYY